MLIKGQEVDNIKLGNTLSQDQLYADKFDYMLSNPPFGVDWKKIEKDIKDEHSIKGFDGRFGAGLPRVSDGSLLFLMHLISKLRDASQGGARIGIILNGSPLFTGGAGSGESEIRRYILEADLLEAIIALPTDMFYNTGIATYVWLLSNKKSDERKGKVQLINGVNLCGKMRKSLGSKRNVMSEDDIRTITRSFGEFEVVEGSDASASPDHSEAKASPPVKTFASTTATDGGSTGNAGAIASKIFDSYEFGYRRITIERPLRESYQFSDERIASLRFAPKPLNAAMQWMYAEYSEACYASLADVEDEIRIHFKANFKELKEKQIKDLLDTKLWLTQKSIMDKAQALQAHIGSKQHDDMNAYDAAIKAAGVKLDAKEKKQITSAVSWKNPDAEKVIKKIHKTGTANLTAMDGGNAGNAGRNSLPYYGLFEVDGQIIEYKPDSDLRDHENVALDPSRSVNEINETYFKKEVLPHVPDAWIDASKKDAKDEEIGIVGYEIPFNRHFYVYQPPRPLEEIDAELDAVSAEIMKLLQEVHS